MAQDLPELVVADAAALSRWLAEHADDGAGVLLVLAKKGADAPTRLRYDEAVEEALCHGWIDGQAGRRDAATYTVRFTPRRARSTWSQRNTGIVERLVAQGRMRARGEAEVALARADGRWEAAYAGPATMTEPTELTAALDVEPGARAAFAALDRSTRYALLHRVHTAVRPATRTRRAERFAAALARGQDPLAPVGRPAP